MVIITFVEENVLKNDGFSTDFIQRDLMCTDDFMTDDIFTVVEYIFIKSCDFFFPL